MVLSSLLNAHTSQIIILETAPLVRVNEIIRAVAAIETRILYW